MREMNCVNKVCTRFEMRCKLRTASNVKKRMYRQLPRMICFESCTPQATVTMALFNVNDRHVHYSLLSLQISHVRWRPQHAEITN